MSVWFATVFTRALEAALGSLFLFLFLFFCSFSFSSASLSFLVFFTFLSHIILVWCPPSFFLFDFFYLFDIWLPIGSLLSLVFSFCHLSPPLFPPTIPRTSLSLPFPIYFSLFLFLFFSPSREGACGYQRSTLQLRRLVDVSTVGLMEAKLPEHIFPDEHGAATASLSQCRMLRVTADYR